MTAPFVFENQFRKQNFVTIVGVDEVGRGCIAGPVVAGAVILDPNHFPIADQMKDSKKLSAKKRASLYPEILKYAVSYGIGSVDPQTIDSINILRASLLAMKLAVLELSIQPDLCLVDGNQKIPFDYPQQTIVQGDQKVTSIQAASIIAKVYRDQWMDQQSSQYPQYAFKQNKGYGTITHRKALRDFGPCLLHRKSFKVKTDF